MSHKTILKRRHSFYVFSKLLKDEAKQKLRRKVAKSGKLLGIVSCMCIYITNVKMATIVGGTVGMSMIVQAL